MILLTSRLKIIMDTRVLVMLHCLMMLMKMISGTKILKVQLQEVLQEKDNRIMEAAALKNTKAS